MQRSGRKSGWGLADMKLSESELARFREDGFLFMPGLFAAGEVAPLRQEMDRIAGLERDEVLRDEHGELRLAMAMQRYSPLYDRLLRHPRLLEPARQILGPDLYAHQYKIVAKDPLGKLDWPWHQDAASWRAYDGMPAPVAMNYAVFLDDVTEHNGPITLIPGSHSDGILEGVDSPLPGGKSPLRTLPREALETLVAKGGMTAPKGPAGSAIFFSGCLAHASGPNLSPWTRYIVYVTYNPVSNAIQRPTRPDYYAARDGFVALEALGDDCLELVAV